MADWGWTVVETFNKGAANSGRGYLAVQGGKLWVALAGTGLNKIYYSEDGVTYTEDTAWTLGFMDDLWSLNDVLYAVINDVSVDQNFTIYRRGASSWTAVANTAAGSELYASNAHAYGAGRYFMIGGRYQADQGLRIWRYDTTNGLVLDCSFNLPFRMAEDVYYYGGNWYAAVVGSPYSNTKAILRRVGANNWVEDCTMDAWSNSGFRQFGAGFDGLYIGQQEAPGGSPDFTAIRLNADGNWQYIENPFTDETYYSHTVFHGWDTTRQFVTDRQLEWLGTLYSYIQKLNMPDRDWESTFRSIYKYDEFIEFERDLYVAADVLTASGGYTFQYQILRAQAKTAVAGPPYGGRVCDLVCEHEFGETIYVGIRDEDQHPMIFWLDWEFEDHWLGYHSSAGSCVGVQSMEDGAECIGFGQFDTDKQVIVSEDYLESWDEAQGEFGNDVVTTLEFHPTNANDLVGTRKLDQDLIQTLTQRKPWTDVDTTPFVARCQLRVGDDIFIGSDEANAQPVRMYSSGSWTDKSNGLPTDVAINDLELGF